MLLVALLLLCDLTGATGHHTLSRQTQESDGDRQLVSVPVPVRDSESDSPVSSPVKAPSPSGSPPQQQQQGPVCETLRVTACADMDACPRRNSRSGTYELYNGDCNERWPAYCNTDRGNCGTNIATYLYLDSFDSERNQQVWVLQDGALCGRGGAFSTFGSRSFTNELIGNNSMQCICLEEEGSFQTARNRDTQPFIVECIASSAFGRHCSLALLALGTLVPLLLG